MVVSVLYQIIYLNSVYGKAKCYNLNIFLHLEVEWCDVFSCFLQPSKCLR